MRAYAANTSVRIPRDRRIDGLSKTRREEETWKIVGRFQIERSI